MRVLFWSERFPPMIGGHPVSAAWLLRGLRARGHEFHVIASSDAGQGPDRDEFEGMPVARFPFAEALAGIKLPLMAAIVRRVAALKRSFRPDLVHVGFLGPSVAFHFQTRDAHPAPLLVSMDSGFPEATIGPDSLVGRAFRSADWITCVSFAGLARARMLAPGIGARSSCVHKGRRAPDLAVQPLPWDEPRLLCLGRLEPVKGFDLAIAAFAALTGRFPHLRLLVAGDGSMRPALARSVADAGLEDRVEFAGWVAPESVPALLNRTTILVVPSRSEGLPQVAVEAAWMARPVVATRVGGLPEVVADGETGLLVEPGHHRALADAIARLLGHPGRAAAMGSRARERVRERFTLDATVEAYDRLYRTLVDRGVRPAEAPVS